MKWTSQDYVRLQHLTSTHPYIQQPAAYSKEDLGKTGGHWKVMSFVQSYNSKWESKDGIEQAITKRSKRWVMKEFQKTLQRIAAIGLSQLFFLQNLQIIKLQIFRFSASAPLSLDYLFYNSLKIIVLGGGGGGIDWFIESGSLNGMGLTSRWGDVSCFHQDFVRRIFHVL